MSDLTWSNQTRRLGDLIPWQRNPRRISADKRERLLQSFDEFGQVEPLAVGPNDEIYNGHQRLSALVAEHGPDFEIEVRVASRELSEKEREKLTVLLHAGAVGEWDFDRLDDFKWDELSAWGFDVELGDERLAEVREEIRPRTMFHCLISVPVDEAPAIRDAVEQIARLPGVEVSYGTNG